MKKIICYFIIMCFVMSCPGMAIFPAAVAEGLSGDSGLTLTHSKEDLQELLQKIKSNLVNGLSSMTELILLEDIKDELGIQLVEANNAAEEVRMALPASDLVDFEVKFEREMNGLRDLIEGINDIILSIFITSEQVDNVLNLIEILSPEVRGEILAAKPVLPSRIDKEASVFKTRPVKATGAPPTEADLAATEEILITPEIEALASELGNDVVNIFVWVHNNIDYEPYYGSMKGSSETLIDMAGNDCDQSSLLLALLRASNIPSRYVRGDIELKVADLMNWTGGKTPEAAIAIFERNKIPTSPVYKKEEISRVKFDHIWVEAFNGHNWRMMNPSFKQYTYTEGVGIDDVDETGLLNMMESAVISKDNILSVNQEMVSNYLEEQASLIEKSSGHLTVDEMLGTRKITVRVAKSTQPYLAKGIIDDRKPAEEYSTIPENMRFKVKVILPGNNEYVASISEIAGKRVSIVYIPADAGSQSILDLYGGIYNVPFPSMLVQMKPALQIDGETVATGTSIGLGLDGQSVQIGFLRPGTYDPSIPVTDADWEFTNKGLRAGNRHSVSITTQRTSLDELARLSEKFKNDVIGLPDDMPMTDEMIDKELRLAGMLYFGVVGEFTNQASRMLNVVSIGHVSMGYVVSEVQPMYLMWFLLSLTKGGAHIDVVRNVVCPTSTTGNSENEVAWMKAQGSVATNMEHAMLEITYKIDAVSTGKIFNEASKQGIPIHILNDPETLETDLTAISAYPVVKDHIRTYVNAGYTAMIPQQVVTVGGWSGQGWTVMDEETGAAGYMICGGLHGETALVNGGSLVNSLLHAIHDFKMALAAFAAAGGFASAGFAHIVAALNLYKAAATASLLVSPFGFIGFVIGLIFLVVALVLYIKLFDYLFISYRFIRRTRYAYA